MPYDPEKYRAKRERVLGVRRRGVGFGTLAAAVTCLILGGLATLVLPQTIAALQTRHLEDAIFRVTVQGLWPDEPVRILAAQPGVRSVRSEPERGRLVVTLDSSTTDPNRVDAFLHSQGVEAILLNRVGHAGREHNREP
ncbi:MAG: hypothetical protein AB1634_12110 [Thermodesulfobacteriota bacterium]